MKEELIGGIKNALDRGQPIEEAVQSLINSGYNEKEVRAAAEMVSSGTATTMLKEPEEPKEREEKKLPTLPGKQLPKPSVPKEKKSKGKIILVIVLVVALLGIVGGIFYILFT